MGGCLGVLQSLGSRMGGYLGAMDSSSSKSGDVAALEPEKEQATSCSEFVASQIELSKRHWSELSKSVADSISTEEVAAAKLDNQEVFKEWESHSVWYNFFRTFGDHPESAGSLEVGEKFAEGGQAELFHARVKWRHEILKGTEWVHRWWNEDPSKGKREWVLKVFKEGTFVRDLQHQWPDGLFRHRAALMERYRLVHPVGPRHIGNVALATLLEDGRFAFLMEKEDGDLRRLIERKMVESDHGCGPFSKDLLEEIVYRVAEGMDYLHSYDIVHRDLKASNILVKTSLCGKYLYCLIADYECSVGVVGTGFWRAPEILQALKERNVWTRPELFSTQADAYSYGMMCYEVLTGRVPFQDHPLNDQCSLLMDHVIDHHLRPEVPEYVDDWARKLLHWCWQPDPGGRPSFKEILNFLEANTNSDYMKRKLYFR